MLFFHQTHLFFVRISDFSLISSYFFNTLFIKRNLSWLIHQSIKSLEIKTFILFNLGLAENTILSFFFSFFFLIIDLYFLIPVVITQIFNPAAEHVIPAFMPTTAETKPVEIEAKISKFSV